MDNQKISVIIRVKNDFQNISGYVTNTIFISILLIFFGILIGVDFFSLLCGFLITMVSYTICYFESSKKLCIHSSLTPLVIIYGLRYRL